MKRFSIPALAALSLLLVQPVAAHAQTVKTRDASGREITRRCQPASARRDLPPVSAVVDSARVVQELTSLPRTAATPWLLALTFARDSAAPSVKWVEPAAGPDTALRLVAAAALPRDEPGPWAVRLAVQFGSPAVTVEPALYCPPHPSPNQPVRAAVPGRVQVQRGDRLPPSGRAIRMVAEVDVLEDGQVRNVRLVRDSGLSEVDDEFIVTWRRAVFLPALLEGMPVAGRYRTDGSSPRP